MLHSLHIAASNVKRPQNAVEAYNTALPAWLETWNAFTDANCWHFFKDDRNKWGNWKPTAGKSFIKVFVDALRPHQFRESVRYEFIIHDTAMGNPETISQHVFRLATQ